MELKEFCAIRFHVILLSLPRFGTADIPLKNIKSQLSFAGENTIWI